MHIKLIKEKCNMQTRIIYFYKTCKEEPFTYVNLRAHLLKNYISQCPNGKRIGSVTSNICIQV